MQDLADLKILFEEYPLSKELLYSGNSNIPLNPYNFIGLSFEYYCSEEKANKTFEIELPPATKEYYGNLRGDIIPNNLFENGESLNYKIHLNGICKSCKKKQVDFLISIKSDLEYKFNRQVKSIKDLQFTLMKIGVYPELHIDSDKAIQKYFDRETNNWYFKGTQLYSQGYGIGSLSYFRRIVEKELMKILNDVSDLNSSDPKLKALVEKFEKNNQISTLYKDSFSLLPQSLQILGDNPFEVLYKLTSKGLHNMTEEKSLEVASSIHKVLDFVVKKIYEEKSELQEIRKVLKDLKK